MTPTTHIYPGMGATKEMFPAPWQTLPNSTCHDWPDYQGETTIVAIANRLIAEHHIQPGDTIVGTSLGGIIACELANQLPLRAIILVASAAQPTEINHLITKLHPIIDLAPITFATLSSRRLPSELAQMFAQANPAFIRASCKAIFTWQGLAADTPLLRIHGTRDWVITKPQHVDLSLPGGHLIASTHAADCVAAIHDFQSHT